MRVEKFTSCDMEPVLSLYRMTIDKVQAFTNISRHFFKFRHATALQLWCLLNNLFKVVMVLNLFFIHHRDTEINFLFYIQKLRAFVPPWLLQRL